MKVDVSSTSPILFMDVDADDFGKLFASMAADEQVEVLRSVVSHMSKHPTQWDYIAIELEEAENLEFRTALKHIVQAMEAET